MPLGRNTSLICGQLALDARHIVRLGIINWRSGIPRYEVALLNQLTSAFELFDCSPHPALPKRLDIQREFFLLHAAGTKVGQQASTDAYGADLAVRVRLPPLEPGRTGRVKVAFIQLKVLRNSKNVELKDHQLRMANTAGTSIKQRSWVAAIDEDIGSLELRSVEALETELSRKGPTEQPYSGHWTPFVHWVYSWLTCELGPYADDDEESFEDKLDRDFVRLGAEQPTESDIELLLSLGDWGLPQSYLRFHISDPETEDVPPPSNRPRDDDLRF